MLFKHLLETNNPQLTAVKNFLCARVNIFSNSLAIVTTVSLFSLLQFPQPDIVDLLAREATRKINAIFCQMSATLHSQNQTLQARVGQLESELKTVIKNFENATTWRENVLSGYPVLFEESRLVFVLKLFGILDKSPDEVTAAELTDVPVVQSGCDYGGFQSKSTTKHWPW